MLMHFAICSLNLVAILFCLGTVMAEDSCSADVVPDLNGAWVCDDKWLLDTDMVENETTGTVKWIYFFELPKFYAVSKIRTITTCGENCQGEQYNLLSAYVWDEKFDQAEDRKLPQEPEDRWIPVEIETLEYTSEGKNEYSGFARRAPYWRIVLETSHTDIEWISEFQFFAKAGLAAVPEIVMTISHGGEIQEDREYLAAPTSNTCDQVTGVPSNVASYYRLDLSFYRKYTSAYGIPILSSYVVDDKALQRACYVVRFMLADREDLRTHMLRNKGRVAIIGRRETVPMVPEMRIYVSWTRRAAGGTYSNPVNVGAEENMLCERGDGYAPKQDIFMHEFAHGVHLIACFTAIRNFNSRLQQSFNYARSRGLWTNTYANTDNREYFAEGVQAYFEQQREGPVGGDGIQNHIDTREELRRHDPTLYQIIDELFPCQNKYIPRCNDVNQRQGLLQSLRLNCNGGTITTTKATTAPGTGSTPTTSPTTTTGGNCIDENKHCSYWAGIGECNKNPSYMKMKCRKSCKVCAGTAPPSVCTNTDTRCIHWRSYCGYNVYVKKHCKKTCDQC